MLGLGYTRSFLGKLGGDWPGSGFEVELKGKFDHPQGAANCNAEKPPAAQYERVHYWLHTNIQ